MSDIIDRAIASAANRFAEFAGFHFEDVCKEVGDKLGSPLEEAFLAALVGTNMLVPMFEIPGMKYANIFQRTVVKVTLQEKIGAYRVDFVLRYFRNGSEALAFAVECDGHDFHERTKEQAARDKARDRAITSAGFRVMRFTGSEIYRDAMGCVNEVIQACLDITDADKRK